MNTILEIANKANINWCTDADKENMQKFVQLILEECQELNTMQSYELSGVLADVDGGLGFDDICKNTIKRVEGYLLNDSFKQHFGFL